MDHLKSAFFEALAQEQNTYVENGRIYIRAHHWAPGEILEEMLTPEALNDAFEDWVAERKEDLIGQADSILRDYSQEDRFQALSEAFQKGAVVPFIGAGLSMPSKYPGWTTF